VPQLEHHNIEYYASVFI